jgi:Ser/Thr protein kinase RdoA (MazF antagonist)
LTDPVDTAAALALWRETEGGRATLINLSENHTFRVDGGAAPVILRLHRPGYQTRQAIESELAWLAAIGRDAALPVPRPLPGRDGRLLQEPAPDRFAVLFAMEPGTEPAPDGDLVPLFRTLGDFAARAHSHVEAWQPPAGFIRPVWDASAILNADGLWSDWRVAPHVSGAARTTLDRLEQRLRDDLAAYGTGAGRFGLIHADMRLANLLVDGDRVTLIDFDDCGFGWFMYDFAAALSFIETSPQAPHLRRAWCDGYTAIRPLSADDLAIIDAMVLLRRMALLAWIGSHGETDLAQAHADNFAADTAELAERYLDN